MQTTVFDAAVWITLMMALVAAISDLRTGSIGNRTVALGALLGALAQLATVPSFELSSLGTVVLRIVLGAVICALVPVALYAAGGLGGGDVKLFIAIGVCLGPLTGLEVELMAFLVALSFLPVHLALRGRLKSTLQNSARMVSHMLRRKGAREAVPESELTVLRFAPAIFVAALVVVLRNAGTP